jgi:hypothetical protein
MHSRLRATVASEGLTPQDTPVRVPPCVRKSGVSWVLPTWIELRLRRGMVLTCPGTLPATMIAKMQTSVCGDDPRRGKTSPLQTSTMHQNGTMRSRQAPQAHFLPLALFFAPIDSHPSPRIATP